MRVLSWNVQGAVPPMGSKNRIRQQVDFIDSVAGCPDLIMLNEVTTVQRKFWRELLRGIGYGDIVDTLDWAAELRESAVPPHQDYNHVNGNLTAVHDEADARELSRKHPSIRYGPWENADLKDWDTVFPEKILNAELRVDDRTINLWNVRAVPGSMHGEEKIKILENTHNRIKKGGRFPCILAGDFNSPQNELSDGTLIPWRYEDEGDVASRWVEAERNLLIGLEEVGMVDVFRSLHGYGDLGILDVSHATRTEDPIAVEPGVVEGLRFDHIIASEELTPVACLYEQEGFACSDHAPIIAEFDV